MRLSVMVKVATIVGARPQFIKAASVSRAIEHLNGTTPGFGVQEVIIHTGQHYDDNMSRIFFDELQIKPPDYNLGVGSGSHGEQTGKMLGAVERVLMKEDPDVVLTYGDTNSTLAGALAAAKMGILSAHVEAGLRSFNRLMAEEINRIITDHTSNILFCPTQTAGDNLRREGIHVADGKRQSKISLNDQIAFVVGDVMYDSILFYKELASVRSKIFDSIGISPHVRHCLVTIHRRENTDDSERLKSILRGLAEIASKQIKVVFPLHPRTEKRIKEENINGALLSSINFINPVGYLDMIQLLQHAFCLITDSGGLQKEAFFLRVPCITTRKETEWIETVRLGWNVLTGTSSERIIDAVRMLMDWDKIKTPFAQTGKSIIGEISKDNIFGNGESAKKIVNIIRSVAV